MKNAGHFWLHSDGRRIYALWWRKFNADNKEIYKKEAIIAENWIDKNTTQRPRKDM